MSDIVIKEELDIKDVRSWRWEKSIKKVQKLFNGTWKTLSKEFLEELYQSKLQCNNGPGNPHGKYSWSQFCEDAFKDKDTGKWMVTKKTVDNWLLRHEIGEDEWEKRRKEKNKSEYALKPKPVNDDTLFIEKYSKNKDGVYTVITKFTEYETLTFKFNFSL